MAISIDRQDLEITDIADIVVTAVMPDAESGGYVRIIRIFGPAVSEGTDLVLISELTLRSAQDTPIKITAPEAEF